MLNIFVFGVGEVIILYFFVLLNFFVCLFWCVWYFFLMNFFNFVFFLFIDLFLVVLYFCWFNCMGFFYVNCDYDFLLEDGDILNFLFFCYRDVYCDCMNKLVKCVKWKF